MNGRNRTLAAVVRVGISTAGAGGTAGRTLTLTSPDLIPGAGFRNAQVPGGFGCSGGNPSPALPWSGAPAGTRSYAMTRYDPDAPTGSGWWHWAVYNLPAATTRLAPGAGDARKNLLPAGAVQGNTDFGQPGYGGPRPPQGDTAHRYIFTVYAPDVDRLDLPRNATAAFVGFNLSGHTLARTTLTAKYGRQGGMEREQTWQTARDWGDAWNTVTSTRSWTTTPRT